MSATPPLAPIRPAAHVSLLGETRVSALREATLALLEAVGAPAPTATRDRTGSGA